VIIINDPNVTRQFISNTPIGHNQPIWIGVGLKYLFIATWVNDQHAINAVSIHEGGINT
jgi:hypothetical protein